MKRSVYTVSSSLPPAELKERMKWEAAIGNRMYKEQPKTVWKWKSEREFTVYLVISEINSGTETYWGTGKRSISWNFVAGTSKTTYFSPKFLGEILPDGSGSVIRGSFRERWYAWLLCITVYAAGLVSLFTVKDILVLVPLLFLLIKHVGMFQNLLYPERIETSMILLDVLDCIVEKAEQPRKF